MIIGLLLMAAALALAFYNIWDSVRVEKNTTAALEQLRPVVLEAVEKASVPRKTEESRPELQPEEEQKLPEIQMEYPDYVLNPNMDMPEQVIDGLRYIGILTIPELELELPVLSEWSYHDLKYGPCRYTGSAYRNDMIICAHNYTSHFRELKNLPVGAEVTFADIDGNVFSYTVVELETVDPDDIAYMESGEWDLTVFTCTVGGAFRVTVRCELLRDSDRLY